MSELAMMPERRVQLFDEIMNFEEQFTNRKENINNLMLAKRNKK